MNVELRLFAAARQTMGRESITLSLADASTVADLRMVAASEYPQLAPLLMYCRFAIDHDYVSDQTVITDQALVACIPPVSGG